METPHINTKDPGIPSDPAMPSKEMLAQVLIQRHTRPVYEAMQAACVGIAGLGGLGSNIAVMLTRLGIGRLILADFDLVDLSNLNRQHYMISHLGMEKTKALAQQLYQINPYIDLTLHTERVTAQNAVSIFKDCPIVCEAFDNAGAKAELVNTILKNCPDKTIVAASGLAGYGSANDIKTRKVMKHFYLSGDNESGIEDGLCLMAPRAALCAAHQANMVLRLILNISEP